MRRSLLLAAVLSLVNTLCFAADSQADASAKIDKTFTGLHDAACKDGKAADADKYIDYVAYLRSTIFDKVMDDSSAADADKVAASKWIVKGKEYCKDIAKAVQPYLGAAGSGTTPEEDQGGDYIDPDCPQKDTRFHDCKEDFQLVGGVEESGLSSLGANTNAFLQAFTRSPNYGPINIWGRIRLLGAPQQAADGIISTFISAQGTLQQQTFSKVGQSVDFVAGIDFGRKYSKSGQYSVEGIAGGGFTTPLNSQDLVLRYSVPDANTRECGDLFRRFQPEFTRLGYVLAPGAAPANCINNGSGVPVTQLAFSNQDRSNFLGKWGVGIRTITRVCDFDENHKCNGAPQRGTVDFVIGQDATLTGGQIRHWVFKIDAVHPLPISGTKWLYIFGSAGIRFQRNQNLDPLILRTLDIKTAPLVSPDPALAVLPLKQANRDFYRIGLAIDLRELFSKAGQEKPKDDTNKNAANPGGGGKT